MNICQTNSKLVLRLSKKLLLLLILQFSFLISISGYLLSQENALDLTDFKNRAETIKNLGLSQEKAYEFLKILTSVGSRLTGSPEAARAVELMVRLMSDLGFDQVWKEPVQVNHWVRGKAEKGLVKSQKFGQRRINICALGNSIGTPSNGIEAGVVEVNTFDRLSELKETIEGKIVFFNVPMDRTIVEPFAAYGRAAQFRLRGASEAARYGARAVLIRSVTYRIDDYPHTGLMVYDEQYPKIPAAAISTSDAERLSRWLKDDPELRIFLKMHCQQLEPVISSNVIGQLTGTEKPEEIILVGGHLDSWDLSPGAHDDASGCVVAIEALRLIKESGLRPKRTIRAVLFMDEEFGGTGGRAYVRAEARQKEKHLVAIEQDHGGFVPIGLAIGGGERVLNKIKTIENILKPLGINWIRTGGGGVDIGPLVEQGVIPGSLIPDSQRYFDYHHSALDVPSAVHPRELEFQAIILAIVVYFLAQEGL
ncbi:MAG: M20/M25/M40 family metallo-hydrolase [Candidatus Aminicenantes bacterium]|nr:M20/M25/M40 family metallo-hydrolase [Candidatus Aminicenantes bacterium]